MSLDGMLTIKIFAWRKLWTLLDGCPISKMNGSILKDDNTDKRFSDVVEAFTLCPASMNFSANGSPSHPLPNMLMVFMPILSNRLRW